MGKAASRNGTLIAFRRMRPEDAEAVEKVERASFSVPWSRASFWEEAANDRTHYLLAFDGEEIIGYAGAWIIADEAQVTNVAIAPKHRERGIGRKLMAELMRAAKARGAVRMTLEVRPSNTAAIALYESLGFKDFGRRPGYYRDNGEDAIIMWNMEI